MEYIKKFENYNNQNSVLIVVDVQKSFRKYFNEKYLNELNKYCKNFNTVYQIWDNHIDGKNIDKDYLYDNDPDVPIHNDLYYFPNQKDLIETFLTTPFSSKHGVILLAVSRVTSIIQKMEI